MKRALNMNHPQANAGRLQIMDLIVRGRFERSGMKALVSHA
jgi:hypothetical protein